MTEATKGTTAGFCKNCEYIRQDTDGRPDTDCLCMAERKHKLGCRYLALISCKIEISCSKHNREFCPECDSCNCDTIEGDVVNPNGPPRPEARNPGYVYIRAAFAHDPSWS